MVAIAAIATKYGILQHISCIVLGGKSSSVTGSADRGDMLLHNLAKEIEQKIEDNSGSTRTQIDLKPNSTRIETLLVQPIYELRNASSTYQ